MSERMSDERLAMFKQNYERCQADNSDGEFDEDKFELFKGLEAEREEVERLRHRHKRDLAEYNRVARDLTRLVERLQTLIAEWRVNGMNESDTSMVPEYCAIDLETAIAETQGRPVGPQTADTEE